jgi:hypothetical protein
MDMTTQFRLLTSLSQSQLQHFCVNTVNVFQLKWFVMSASLEAIYSKDSLNLTIVTFVKEKPTALVAPTQRLNLVTGVRLVYISTHTINAPLNMHVWAAQSTSL